VGLVQSRVPRLEKTVYTASVLLRRTLRVHRELIFENASLAYNTNGV